MMAVSVCNPAACLSRSSSLPACTIALAANFQGPSRNLLFGLRNRWSSGLQSTSASVKCGFGRRTRAVVSCKATEITERDFEVEVLKSDSPVLVEFIANWCGPCRLISPIVDWASEEYEGRLKVVKIDHDANPKLIDEYKVYGLPALILFKNGQEVPESRREGAMTKVKLKEYLDALLESVTAA